MYIYIYNNGYVCIYIYTNMKLYVYNIHTYSYIYIYTYIYTHRYTYINTCVCVFLYTYILSHLQFWNKVPILEYKQSSSSGQNENETGQQCLSDGNGYISSQNALVRATMMVGKMTTTLRNVTRTKHENILLLHQNL